MTSASNDAPCTVVIALGSNLGDRSYNLRRAIAALPVRVVRVSAFLETEPVDAPPPMYLNAVVVGHTTLPPLELLDALLELEKRLGRTRTGRRSEPRIIDLDLIAYDALRLRTPRLTLPHPRAHQREFVMAPLRSIATVPYLSS
jgi:2-amino-4-hydroxy-6-hydroxymethyldihydropteridine diphosphokinase